MMVNDDHSEHDNGDSNKIHLDNYVQTWTETLTPILSFQVYNCLTRQDHDDSHFTGDQTTPGVQAGSH